MRNTPAICRKCYVHPGIVDAYRRGVLPGELRDLTAGCETLPAAEEAILRLLEQFETV